MKTVYIILAFCAGLITGYLLFNHDPDNPTAVVFTGESSSKVIHRIDSAKGTADSILRQRSKVLASQLLIVNAELQVNSTALMKERQRIRSAQSMVLCDTINQNDNMNESNACVQIDTLNRITDSIIDNYETKLQMIGEIVAVRDSQLIVCNTSYMGARDLINEQIARERQLTIKLNTSLKQQNRSRVQNRLLSLGLLFVAGVTTSLIIKSNQ